ncbi:dihydrofolate reductase family protein [Chryseobacterium kwangjuense]|uniref:Dihydrofolate reductase family protein n=1 Tax=Chryseobacterium kwangjuense TaxID=267125 RepID=A0ABW9K0W2_9FLAO
MRKIILDLAVSLDGFIEGPNGETDWCIMDDDMNFDGFLASIDTILYGRVSYDAWARISLMKMPDLKKKNSGNPFTRKINMFFHTKNGKMQKQFSLTRILLKQ